MMTSAEAFSDCVDREWVMRQTNGVLSTENDIVVAERFLAAAELFLHPDRPKRWDEMVALFHAYKLTGPDDAVLDAGGEYYSTFLPNLRRLGRNRLTAINTVFREDKILGDVRYRPGDVTGSHLEPGSFAFIACLSVIEHGVPIRLFLAEQARLLRPGGQLFVSCDYWDEGIDTEGRCAYGVPVRVFDRAELREIVCEAEAVGLRLVGPQNWRCQDKVVHWSQMNLRYTFATMLFQA